MLRFSRPTPDAVKNALSLKSGATDHFVICDSLSEFAGYAEQRRATGKISAFGAKCWTNNRDFSDACRLARTGDLAAVEPSAALLDKFEQFTFPTSRHTWRDDMAGSVANVPAFIAGTPCAMRRRVKQQNEGAPIAIVADLTSSSAISNEQIQKRGAAILALVRAVSNRRPLELWVCTMLDAKGLRDCITIAARIETAPLDLASAAHALTCVSMSRGLMYSCSRELGYIGDWPYGKAARHRPHMAAILSPAFSHVTETLCLPAIHENDQSVTAPEKWLGNRLAELAPVNLDDAA